MKKFSAYFYQIIYHLLTNNTLIKLNYEIPILS